MNLRLKSELAAAAMILGPRCCRQRERGRTVLHMVPPAVASKHASPTMASTAEVNRKTVMMPPRDAAPACRSMVNASLIFAVESRPAVSYGWRATRRSATHT